MASNAYATVLTPLPEQKQLRIIKTPLTGTRGGAEHVEYRVYNWRRLPSGRIIRGDGWGLGDMFMAGLLGWMLKYIWGIWLEYQEWPPTRTSCIIASFTLLLSILYVRSCLFRVVYQSVIPLPGLGLQLSTTHGISLPHPLHPKSPLCRLSVPLNTSYNFIPLSDISTVVINEGLKRWNVRYYLAVIKRQGEGVIVALDEIWAPVSVLREVYHGVRESLFHEYADPP